LEEKGFISFSQWLKPNKNLKKLGLNFGYSGKFHSFNFCRFNKIELKAFTAIIEVIQELGSLFHLHLGLEYLRIWGNSNFLCRNVEIQLDHAKKLAIMISQMKQLTNLLLDLGYTNQSLFAKSFQVEIILETKAQPF